MHPPATHLVLDDLAVLQGGTVTIRRSGEVIGWCGIRHGKWLTAPPTGAHQARQDALTALVRRWNERNAR